MYVLCFCVSEYCKSAPDCNFSVSSGHQGLCFFFIFFFLSITWCTTLQKKSTNIHKLGKICRTMDSFLSWKLLLSTYNRKEDPFCHEGTFHTVWHHSILQRQLSNILRYSRVVNKLTVYTNILIMSIHICYWMNEVNTLEVSRTANLCSEFMSY